MNEPKHVKLGDVAQVTMGQSPDSKYYNEEGDGYPFLQGCAQFGPKFPDTTVFCSVPKRVAPADSILFSVRAPVGDINIADKKYCIGRGVAAIIPRKVEPRLLYYTLKFVSPQFKRIAQGSTFEAVNSSDVSNFLIPTFESHDAQVAIADVLSTVDRAIELTEALIAKLRRIKAGLMHDLLTRGIDEQGNLRDPTTHEFKESPLGLIPVEWEVKSIGEIASFVGSGITPTGGSQVYGHEGIIFIRSQNVYNDGLILNDVAYIDESINQRMRRSQVFSNDVLLNITGASIGRCCFVPEGFPRANVNQHVCIIRQRNVTLDDALFLSSYIASPFGQRQIKMLNAGGNREGLNYQEVKSILAPLPKQVERTRFAHISAEIHDAIQSELDNYAKYLRLKTGLMQDLLTGRVSVEPLIEKGRRSE